MAVEYTILLADRNLSYVADPILNWISIDVTLKFNEPSSGHFVIPAWPWVADQVVAGRRVTIIRNLGAEYDYQSQLLISGPIEEVLEERSDDGENSGFGVLTVHFADDLAQIATRLAYPDPAQQPSAQTTDRWQFTGKDRKSVV